MVPRKTKTLYKQVADEMNLPESAVEDVIRFYYSSIRQNLSNIDAVNINVHKLGIFTLKKSRIAKEANLINNCLINSNISTFKGYDKKKYLEDKLFKLTKGIQMIAKENLRKKVKKTKYEL